MIRITKFCLIIILYLLISSCGETPVNQILIEGKVQRVVSGQTLQVIIQNQSYRVRLTGLEVFDNSPNSEQQAKDSLSNLLTNNGQYSLNSVTVFLETNLQEKDAYDRLWAYVWHDNQLLNQQIIKNGNAIAILTYTDGKYDNKLINAQNYARIMNLGIWE